MVSTVWAGEDNLNTEDVSGVHDHRVVVLVLIFQITPHLFEHKLSTLLSSFPAFSLELLLQLMTAAKN